MSNLHIIKVPSNVEMRLDKFLMKYYYTSIPYALLAKWLRNRQIKVNNKRANLDYRINTGDEITCPIWHVDHANEPKTIDKLMLKKIEQSIIFENDKIIILNKPYGLATQGGTNVHLSLDDYLIHLRPQDDLKLTHRLDKHTTGCIILAKNLSATQEIGKLFKLTNIEKQYIAVVHGIIEHMQGTISEPLVNLEKDSNETQEAYTKYEVIEHNKEKNYSILKLWPKTGRKHQLRRHLAMIDFPIIGDRRYGQKDGAKYLHLHSYSIRIFGLLNDEILAPIPEHIMSYCSKNNLNNGYFTCIQE